MVIGCLHEPADLWHLPKNGQPGPIRNGGQSWLCLTVNDSLLETTVPWSVEVRKVSLAPCDGRPSQDFFMPEREWAAGCIGVIRWALDHNYQLASRLGEAVMSKMRYQHDALWDVRFWERGWVLSASAQRMLLHTLVILALVLLLLQAFCLLRTFFIYINLFFVALWNGPTGICATTIATAQHCPSRARELFWGISQAKNVEVHNLYNSNRMARVQRAVWVMQPLLSLVLIGNIRSRPREMIWSFFDPPEI